MKLPSGLEMAQTGGEILGSVFFLLLGWALKLIWDLKNKLKSLKKILAWVTVDYFPPKITKTCTKSTCDIFCKQKV